VSYLREIMQRLNARHAAQDPPADAEPAHLEAHLSDYRNRLLGCSPAMLQYERAWLEEHIATLELCCTDATMARSAGGVARVKTLLEESRRFQELLDARVSDLGLEPVRHRAAVVPSEHAWELSQPALRRQWGIDSPCPDPEASAAEPS
jgi:hypothetical protein